MRSYAKYKTMSTTNTLSQQLLDLLATRNLHPEMLDKMGKPAEAEDAKTLTFDYIGDSGKNYGTMVIVLDADNDMKIMYGDNLGRTMEGDDKEEFFNFLQHLNQKATMNRWTHSISDISQLKHTMQGMAAIQEGLFEGYYGTRKISYVGQPTEARLQIVHSKPLGENDLRYRKIDKIFIETVDQERFLLGFKSLPGARAMLEHVRQGGKPYDVRGTHITEMVNEISVLARFNRASSTRLLEGVTQELVAEAQNYYQELRENLKHLATGRGYTNYFESWHPATITEQEGVVDNIKTLFIEQSIDSRIEAALPLLAKIQQRGQDMKEVDIFESWINQITEGTWNLPETPEQLDKLKTLMTKELIVGPDATNATEQLYDLVGDDELFDRLSDLAARDPRANAWNDTEVMARLKELGIETPTPSAPGNPAEPQTGATAPVAAQVPPNPAPQPAPAAPVAEELNAIRRAAGLPVLEGRLLDESGEALDHILNRFKHEVANFKESGEIDNDLYDALFDYYSDSGDMPYGVAKARTGDPHNWIADRLNQHLGLDEMDIQGTAADPMAGNEAMPMAESSCNMTAEGEYCPEHGLAECGYMESMGGTVAGSVAPVLGEADGGDIWITGKWDGDLSAVPGTRTGSALSRAQQQVEFTRGRISDIQRVDGPPPDAGNLLHQDMVNMVQLEKPDGTGFVIQGHDVYVDIKDRVGTDDGSVGRAVGQAWLRIQRPRPTTEGDDPMNARHAVTDSFYESQLNRMKKLALGK